MIRPRVLSLHACAVTVSLSCAPASGVVVADDHVTPSVDSGSPDHAAPPADGGPVAIWTPQSLGFVLVESGGATPLPGYGYPCTPSSPTWSFDASARSLTRSGCAGQPPQSLDAAVTLSPEAAGGIVSLLSSVRLGASETPVCGGDGAVITLKVLGPNGGQDFISCMGDGPGTLVSFNDLSGLAAQLDADIQAAAEGVDAGTADVSVTTTAADGGASE